MPVSTNWSSPRKSDWSSFLSFSTGTGVEGSLKDAASSCPTCSSALGACKGSPRSTPLERAEDVSPDIESLIRAVGRALVRVGREEVGEEMQLYSMVGLSAMPVAL